jgi:hypothetical protein
MVFRDVIQFSSVDGFQPTKLHGVTFHNIVTLISSAVRTTKLIHTIYIETGRTISLWNGHLRIIL